MVRVIVLLPTHFSQLAFLTHSLQVYSPPHHDRYLFVLDDKDKHPILKAGGMASLDKRKEERLIKAVKDLSKLPPNKRCADCTEKLPQYVNLTFNTFICTGMGLLMWLAGWVRTWVHVVR